MQQINLFHKFPKTLQTLQYKLNFSTELLYLQDLQILFFILSSSEWHKALKTSPNKYINHCYNKQCRVRRILLQFNDCEKLIKGTVMSVN